MFRPELQIRTTRTFLCILPSRIGNKWFPPLSSLSPSLKLWPIDFGLWGWVLNTSKQKVCIRSCWGQPFDTCMRFASLALLLCDYAWLSFSLRLQSSFAEKACCVFACQLERPIGLLPSQLPSQFRKTSLVRAVLFPSTPLKMGITDKLDKGYTLYLVNINSTQRLQSAATLCSKQGVCMVSLLLMLTNHVCILWCFCIATCGSLSRRLWQVKSKHHMF